jgi:hypothetical protein
MRVEDVYVQRRRSWVRLHEKGGKRHKMPCHHNLDTYLRAYIDGSGIGGDRKNTLFPTARGRTGYLSGRAMTQADAYRMIGGRWARYRVAARSTKPRDSLGCEEEVR